jgi:hypothetical protein
MTKQTPTTKPLPAAPEYSAWGRGEEFLMNLIKSLEKKRA